MMKKIAADDPESRSADIVAENLEHLKRLFPEAFTEGKIDFDVLRQLLGGEVDEREEKYGLNWHGKRRARQLALTPSTGTLRPCQKESVDWDATQNLMIEGDNLEVLKLLQKSYAGKVKLIYIDPPYNTGNDFVYPDNFRDSIRNYLELTSQIEGGAKIGSNTEASGRFHTSWLNMMYPRLKLARELLQNDGVIFISVDDGELANLNAICSEIFGEENFVCVVVWQKKYAKQNDSKTLSVSHDYLLLYARRIEAWIPGELERGEEQLKGYRNPDNDPRGRWQSVVYTCNKSRSERPNLYYSIKNPFTGEECWPHESRVWAYERPRTDANIQEGRLWWGKNGELQKPRLKSFLSEVGAGIVPDTLWFREKVGDTQEAVREITGLFGAAVFDTPKPRRLLERCIEVANVGSSDIVMDFFSGSGTAAHAVLSSNSANDRSARFLVVQIPEPLKEDNRNQEVAANYCRNLGLPQNVAELTKERLRRAASEIQEGNRLFAGDLGFRVFKLDSSNIRAWDSSEHELEESLLEFEDHLKAGRSEEDVLYEVLLKLGLNLCVPIEVRPLAGKQVYSVGGGVLMACLAEKITRDEVEPLAEGIVAWRRELSPAGDTTCVFRDSAFADDVAKTNLAAILNQHGIENVRSL